MTGEPPRTRPHIPIAGTALAVWKFASCDGCQPALLDRGVCYQGKARGTVCTDENEG